jgi:hypothetical protein
MKQLFIKIFILLIIDTCYSQSKTIDSLNYSKIIKEQAETMSQFLLKKDFKSFIRFTYPKLVEMMGGEQKMIESLEKSFIQMEAEGTGFLNITIGEPSRVILFENELQSTLPQALEIKLPNGRVHTKSTLIAISIDKGKNWYFIDTSSKDIQTMKSVLPNLSEQLIIPEKEKPTFYND